MTNQEILTKAIQKAIDGGWELPSEAYDYSVQQDRVIVLTSMALDEDGYESPGTWRVSTYEIIFNHDFAKALWGAHKLVGVQMTGAEYVYQWQYHLQQMVIAEDPVKYLGENL